MLTRHPVYTLFSLPLAVVAFLGKASTVANGVVFAEVLYSFQGLAFVAIFVCTYRVFGGRPWRIGVGSYTLQGSAAKASGESFEALEKGLSPVTPKEQQPWKPAHKEWSVPLDRSQSTRSRPYSVMSAVSSQSRATNASGLPPPLPDKPMPALPDSRRPLARAPTHRRVKSDDTIVEGMQEISRESSGSLVTIVEVPTPEPSPEYVPEYSASRNAPRMPLAAVQPGEFDRMRSMTKTPPSALSKKSFQSPGKSSLPRKESVRFAPNPTVFGDSPIEESAPAVPVPMPVRPRPVATPESTLRSPVRKPVRRTDSIVALSNALDVRTAQPGPPPRKNLPQPTVVIPGHPERHERDTIFVMETPVQLVNRPLTEYDMPSQVVNALGRPQSAVDSLYDSDNASSILDYYGAASPGGSAQVSPVNGNGNVDIPSVTVVPDSDDGHKTQPAAPARPAAPPGLLMVPPPMGRRPSATQPRPGYV